MSLLLDQSPKSVRDAFTNRYVHPLALNLILLKEFGPEYFGWEPETVWVEIYKTWGASTSDINKNKIQAMRTIHVTEQPYERWEVFDDVCAGLSGLPPLFDVIQRPSPGRAAYSMDVMKKAREEQKFSEEVLKYVAAVLLDHGLVFAPPPMEEVNPLLLAYVGGEVQKKVGARIKFGSPPSIDEESLEDIQVFKSIQVLDYVESMSRLLLRQLNDLV